MNTTELLLRIAPVSPRVSFIPTIPVESSLYLMVEEYDSFCYFSNKPGSPAFNTQFPKPMFDFSFSNPTIRSYFEDKSNEVEPPVSEFMYIHEHPLVNPNFVAQLNQAILRLSEPQYSRKLTPAVWERLRHYTAEMGKALPEVNKETAASLLNSLREVYRICKDFTGTP